MFSIPIEPLFVFILVLIRVAFFFGFLPVFGDLFLPVRLRLLLAVAVAFICAPLLAQKHIPLPDTLPRLLLLAVPEAVLGFAFGLVMRLVFAAVQFSGQIIGEQIGFGMAQLVDPSQGGQLPVLSELMYLFALLLFFAVNGHHVFFSALARSFDLAPPGALFWNPDFYDFFNRQGANMFYCAVQLSLPVVAVIFVTNVALAMLAKGVPQINIFMESFPVRIFVGLLLLSATLSLQARLLERMFGGMDKNLSAMLELLAR